ncbi:uncharacterized protein TNCV_2951561 [Trichonephila clavipes]|nr:uncharacterized protein TNCV_2951561 [Trichonephila clavipes]
MPSSTVHPKSAALLSVPTIRPLEEPLSGPAYLPSLRESGHDSADCKKKEQCLNCKGEHPAYSRSCPTWITEKEITAVKIKEKISYPEARRVVLARTPVSGKSYASATCKSTSDKCIQCDSKKISARIHPHLLNRRDFHRKLEDDTLTGDCSEDDEDLMDIQSGPSTSSSRGGALPCTSINRLHSAP